MLGRIFRVIVGEIEVRELAEVAGEVELEAIVGAVMPERSDAVASLQYERGDAVLLEAYGCGEAGRAGPDDDWAVHEDAVDVTFLGISHWEEKRRKQGDG